MFFAHVPISIWQDGYYWQEANKQLLSIWTLLRDNAAVLLNAATLELLALGLASTSITLKEQLQGCRGSAKYGPFRAVRLRKDGLSFSISLRMVSQGTSYPPIV